MKEYIVFNGEITNLKIDIIVNAANSTLLGGGGVDGVIHRKAGQKLREECKTLNGCNTGEAKITDAYNLPCDKIIHTVGPIYKDGSLNEKELLENCYKNCIKLASEYRRGNKLDKIRIAFPCISTGAYGFPKDLACKIAVDTIKKIRDNNIVVIFACYEEADYQLYMKEVHSVEIDFFS
jgi:O-acetyl-ADP-ribose deacetylase (regulator of RNase III)